MSDRKTNDSKNHGWNEWANKKNDWNMGNQKRPKLDIHKSHMSQSSFNAKNTMAPAGPSAGRGSSFRRTNSLPSSSVASPQKDVSGKFVDAAQEEFDAMEAKALAEAAAAIELEMAQSGKVDVPLCEYKNPSTSSKPDNVGVKNNGSSGFENLFTEEIAAEDVEECMLLASQEIQASQNASAIADSSFTQAYNIFSKGVDVHSSILDTSSTFKKPPLPPQNVKPLNAPQRTGNNRIENVIKKAPTKMNPMPPPTRSLATNVGKTLTGNPQAEAEVRRLEKQSEEKALEIKSLKDALRTKEGEATILRSQLKQAVLEKEHQKSRSARSTEASEQQFQEQLQELLKKCESLEMKLKFEEAEKKAAIERYKLLTNERLKVVEPQSPKPGPSSSASQYGAPSKTPTRQRNFNSFLNRSTFEEHLSPRRPPSKRPRLCEEGENSNSNCVLGIEPLEKMPKPETRSVGEQTSFDNSDAVAVGAQRFTPLSLGQTLSDRFIGIQLVSVEASKTELWQIDDACLDEKETIPTLGLLKVGSKSRKRLDAIDDSIRPCLLNCAESLQHLMSWNDPSADCPPTRASICHIAQECTGILQYNLLLLLQEVRRPSDKELRDRDRDIVSRSLEILPLCHFDLLNEREWYKEEQGIEMRRCLGILSEIVSVSRLAASLVTGGLEPSDVAVKKHKFTELPEYAFLQQNVSDEDGDRFYILRVLCDMCSTIVDQKLTIAFNGVLAGILTLLKNCAQHNVVEGRGQSYYLDVIRRVLIARPSSTVLLLLVDLLTSVSNCQAIMKGLCTKCDDDDNVLETLHGLCTFTNGSCALQMLFIQLQAVSEVGRWRLIDSVSKWLVAVIAEGTAAPSWILSAQGSNEESHIACCIRLTSSLIVFLFDAFDMLQELIEKEELPSLTFPILPHKIDEVLKSTLIRIMRRIIILFLKLVENNMFRFMARVEGLYELLVQGIERLRKHLDLSSSLERYLEDLLISEQETANISDQETTEDPIATLYLDSVVNILRLS